MMKNRLVSVVVVLVAALLFVTAACSPQATSTAPAANAPAGAKAGPPPKPSQLTMTAWAAGTRTHVMISGLAKGIEEAPSVQIKTFVTPIASERDRLMSVMSGQSHSTSLLVNQAGFVMRGNGPYADMGPQRVRQVFQGHFFPWVFWATEKSGATTWQQVGEKGLRVPTVPGDPTTDAIIKAVIDGLGLTSKVKFVPFSSADASWNGLIEGTLDVSLGGGAPRIVEVQAATKFRTLPLPGPEDTKFWNKVRESLPLAKPYLVKIGDPNISWDLKASGYDEAYAFPEGHIFFASGDASVADIYWLTKGAVEGYPIFKDIHKTLRDDYTIDKMLLPEPLPMPFHEGAIAYYKEIGKWTAAHDKLQEQLVKEEQERIKKK